MSASAPTSDKPEILYIYDALCAWCYGMTPVVEQVRETLAQEVTVNVLSGGMMTGPEAGPLAEAWPFLGPGRTQIARVTGAVFGAGFAAAGEAGTLWLDSEPPARALSIFRQLASPDELLFFAHAMQRAFFEHGHDLNQLATYQPLVTAAGADWAEFARRWPLPETAAATQQELTAVGRIGIQGYPTTILRVGSQGYVLARGYQPYETLLDGVRQALAQAT